MPRQEQMPIPGEEPEEQRSEKTQEEPSDADLVPWVQKV